MTDHPDAEKICPKCGASNTLAELPDRDYRCGNCGLELAHLDTLPTGGVRGVLGWLLDIGSLVNNRYRVTAVLGKGGFGVTYLVDDELLQGKRRALKEVPALLFDEYETRLLGRLNHPAIPDISDRFEVGPMVYQVLEFGGDRTFRIEQERRGGRIPLFVLLPWMHQLCEALKYLHRQDPPVVHRDLKPDNVLLDEHDRVMLIDFGIAKETTPDTVTRTIGRAVSHGFSPPEQVLGTGTDARSDVYSLGAILYFCLAGEMPPGAHERISGQTLTPLSELVPGLPPLIEAAVTQALELNINLRQQSISELADVFDLVQTGSTSAPTVMVTSSSGIGAATGESPLPSVRLDSLRTGAPGSTSRNPPMAVTAARSPSEIRKPPPTGRFLLVAILFLAVGAGAGGGYWWWLDVAQQNEPETAESPAPQPAQLPGKPAKDDGTEAMDLAAIPVAERTEELAVTDQPVTKEEIEVEARDGEMPSVTAAAEDTQAPAPAHTDDEASSTATPASTAAVAAAASSAVLGSAATRRSQPDQSGPYSSVFSDEQSRAAPSTGSPRGTSGASTLMDLFEQQRGTALSAPAKTPAAPPETKAPVAKTTNTKPKPPTPKPTVKKKTAPKKVTVAPKPRYTPKPKPKPKASSASDWGFQYKGARKTD